MSRPCRALLLMTPVRPYTCMCSGPHSALLLLHRLPVSNCCCGSRTSAAQTASLASFLLFLHSPWPPLSDGEGSVRGWNARQVKPRRRGYHQVHSMRAAAAGRTWLP